MKLRVQTIALIALTSAATATHASQAPGGPKVGDDTPLSARIGKLWSDTCQTIYGIADTTYQTTYHVTRTSYDRFNQWLIALEQQRTYNAARADYNKHAEFERQRLQNIAPKENLYEEMLRKYGADLAHIPHPALHSHQPGGKNRKP